MKMINTTISVEYELRVFYWHLIVFSLTPNSFDIESQFFQKFHNFVSVIALYDNGIVLKTATHTELLFEIFGKNFKILIRSSVAFNNRDGFSFSFFVFTNNRGVLHPISAMKLDVLEDCIDAENPKQFEDITAGEYLVQRLKELGLAKK